MMKKRAVAVVLIFMVEVAMAHWGYKYPPTPKTPCTRNNPCTPKTPKTPYTPKTPKTPCTPNNPCTPKTPKTPYTPKAPCPPPPKTPYTPKTPKTPCPPPPGTGKSPPPSGKCPLDAVKLGACVDLLSGLVHVGLGDPVANQCCPVIKGVAALEVALCLCTTIRAKVLNLDVLLPLALSLVASCGLDVPPGFKCPSY